MIQFNILSGKTAGAQAATRHFPFRVGRAPDNDLRLEEDGVWDHHLVVDLVPGKGFTLVVATEAIATVNGEPVQTQILRNGDRITLGSARLEFWLAPARQRGLRFREGFVWALIGLVTLGQLALIYWLIH